MFLMYLKKYRKPIKTLLALVLAYLTLRWYFWNCMMFPMVNSLSFSPDGKTLAGSAGWHPAHSGEIEGWAVVRLWDVQSGKTIYRLSSLPQANWVLFSPDGKRLASGEGSDRCSMWNAQSGERDQTSILTPPQICHPEFLPWPFSIRWFATNNELKNWHSQKRKLERLKLTLPHRQRYPVAISHDDATAAFIDEKSRGDEYSLQLWNVATGRMKRDLGTDRWESRAIAFSQDGTTLAAAGSDDSIKIFEVQSGKLRRSLKAQTVHGLKRLAISPDGSKLALGDLYGPVELWDIPQGKLLHAWKID